MHTEYTYGREAKDVVPLGTRCSVHHPHMWYHQQRNIHDHVTAVVVVVVVVVTIVAVVIIIEILTGGDVPGLL